MKNKKKLLDDVFNYRKTVILLTGAKTGLFDFIIENASANLEEICREFNWSERAAEIFMNTLCAVGYLHKKGSEYKIAADYTDIFSGRNYFLLREWLLHEWRLMNRWVHLPEVLESGRPYREPEKTKTHRNHRNFIMSMAHREKENMDDMLKAVSLDDCRHLLDLGGGPGIFAIGLAEKYPGLRATVFDTPETEDITMSFIRNSPAGDRIEFRGGDFISDDLGSAYDAALLSSILHIYGPADNKMLLKKVYRSMTNPGRIIIRDFLLHEDKTKPVRGALFAVNMLINTDHGNAYTFNEMKSWLAEAGFRNIRKNRLDGRMLLLEADK